MWFSLYDEINRLALSSDDGDTSIILSLSIYAYACIPNLGGGGRGIPWICYIGGMAHATPVCTQVILRVGQVAVSRE